MDPFLWPITIYNPGGVIFEDLVEAIYLSFAQSIWPNEWTSFHPDRRDAIERAHAARLSHHEVRRAENAVRGQHALAEDLGDEILRVDYLLGHSYFRGIEPCAHGNDWILHLGPA